MQLKAYLKEEPRGTATRVAREVGVSPVMVWQWVSGRKEVPVDRCTAIELATWGRVMRWDLRPGDWFRHWPELMERRDAPSLQRDIQSLRA